MTPIHHTAHSNFLFTYSLVARSEWSRAKKRRWSIDRLRGYSLLYTLYPRQDPRQGLILLVPYSFFDCQLNLTLHRSPIFTKIMHWIVRSQSHSICLFIRSTLKSVVPIISQDLSARAVCRPSVYLSQLPIISSTRLSIRLPTKFRNWWITSLCTLRLSCRASDPLDHSQRQVVTLGYPPICPLGRPLNYPPGYRTQLSIQVYIPSYQILQRKENLVTQKETETAVYRNFSSRFLKRTFAIPRNFPASDDEPALASW